MKSLKKQWALVVAICLMIIPSACNRSSISTPNDVKQDTTELYFPTNTNNQELSASFPYIEKNVYELYQNSENIVVANILDYDTYTDDYIPKVFSQAKVTEVLKGNLQVGNEITISETGKHLEDGSDISIGGIPLLYPGMKVILFLDEEAPLLDPTRTGYGLVGSYLGKFIYHPDGTIYNFSLLGGDDAMTLSDVTGPLTEEEFRSLLPQESTTINTEITQPTAIS
jgi:hypothetical protein